MKHVEMHNEIKIFGIKIKFYKKSYFYKIRRFIFDLYFYIKRLGINYNKYKIIPIGTYCFSRCIVTFNKLKPTKSMGEKSYPFDLADFSNFDKIIDLINNHFENFFDDIEYDSVNCIWKSKLLNAIFPHDKDLSREDFILRYKRRIDNFYKDIISDRHVYLLLSTQQLITEEQIQRLKNLVEEYRNGKPYDIVIINQNHNRLCFNIDNVSIIEQSQNANKLEYLAEHDWAYQLSTRKTREAQEIYNEITKEFINIIKSTKY